MNNFSKIRQVDRIVLKVFSMYDGAFESYGRKVIKYYYPDYTETDWQEFIKVFADPKSKIAKNLQKNA